MFADQGRGINSNGRMMIWNSPSQLCYDLLYDEKIYRKGGMKLCFK